MFLLATWRIVELDLGEVSSKKFQWTEEDTLGDRWAIINLQMKVDSFFLWSWCYSLMCRRWEVVKMKQLIAVAMKSSSEIKISVDKCAEEEFLIRA